MGFVFFKDLDDMGFGALPYDRAMKALKCSQCGSKKLSVPITGKCSFTDRAHAVLKRSKMFIKRSSGQGFVGSAIGFLPPLILYNTS